MATYKVEVAGRQVYVNAPTEKRAGMVGTTMILLGWPHEWNRLAFKPDLGPTVTLATFDEVQFAMAATNVRIIGIAEMEKLNMDVRKLADPSDRRSNLIERLVYDPPKVGS